MPPFLFYSEYDFLTLIGGIVDALHDLRGEYRIVDVGLNLLAGLYAFYKLVDLVLEHVAAQS